MTISYLSKLHPHYTNRRQLKTLLCIALEDVALDANLAVELDPTLKTQHEEVMMNGDKQLTP